MSDYVIHGTAGEGHVLAFACVSTDMTEEARVRHGLTPVTTAALGRTMTAAAMMACEMKNEDESLSIQIQGNGPARGVFATADGAGHVRGYVGNPKVELPLNQKGKLDVAGALGIGVMSIVKDMGLKEPYVGTTHLVTSEIAEDLAYYFVESEQIPSAVGLGVLVRPDGSVWTSGGFILQLMPGASDEMAGKLQERVENFPPLTTFLAEGNSPEQLLEKLLEGLAFRPMGRKDVCFRCNCSREKVTRALLSVGENELLKMIRDGKPVEMTCHYCNEHYSFTPDEVRRLLEKSKAQPQEKENEKDPWEASQKD